MSQTKVTQLASFQQMVAGLLKHFTGQSLVFNGATYKVDDLVATLNNLGPQITAADNANVTWKQLLSVANKAKSGFAPTLKALRRYLQGVFGIDSQQLLDFGITPELPPVKTAQVKAGAVVKSAATRVARHTMGSRQKAEIHGSVAPPTAAVPPTTGGKAS